MKGRHAVAIKKLGFIDLRGGTQKVDEWDVPFFKMPIKKTTLIILLCMC